MVPQGGGIGRAPHMSHRPAEPALHGACWVHCSTDRPSLGLRGAAGRLTSSHSLCSRRRCVQGWKPGALWCQVTAEGRPPARPACCPQAPLPVPLPLHHPKGPLEAPLRVLTSVLVAEQTAEGPEVIDNELLLARQGWAPPALAGGSGQQCPLPYHLSTPPASTWLCLGCAWQFLKAQR